MFFSGWWTGGNNASDLNITAYLSHMSTKQERLKIKQIGWTHLLGTGARFTVLSTSALEKKYF